MVFLAFNVLLIAGFLRQRWRYAHDPDAPPLPRRLTGKRVRAFAIRQLLLVGVLAITWVTGDWTAGSVGIDTRSALWIESIVAGETGFLTLMLVYALLLFVSRRQLTMQRAAARGNLFVWPRKRSHKIVAGIFIMGFNPFTEELVMRGVLIHQWSLILGSTVIPIIVGFVLNSLLHWYQGWRMQLWHALYFAMAVYLLYWWGLIAAITAHVFGDAMPILTLRRSLRRIRATQRAARAARAAQAA